MDKTYPLNRDENIVMLSSEIVYAQRSYWCNASSRRLSMSFMSPRKHYDFDRKEVQPCIVFVCGGGFEKQSITAWTPELAYFAKRGYSVATVGYSVEPFTQWPEQIEEVKEAIRFIRAHAKELWIDPDRIAIMGESAGGYLATLAAVTADKDIYNKGENLDVSSAVTCAVPFWPVVNLPEGEKRRIAAGNAPNPNVVRTKGAPNAAEFIDANTPPFCVVTGLADHFGCDGQSAYLVEQLEKAGIETDFLQIEGADHADAGAVNSAVKADVLAFLDRHMKAAKEGSCNA